MGSGVARRCARAGVTVYGYDPHVVAVEGVTVVSSIKELLQHVEVILLLVPAGDAVDEALAEIIVARATSEGAAEKQPPIIIDGGNSWYKDSLRRHALLTQDQLSFLDMGISGGVHGEKDGFCVMVGGNTQAFAEVEPLLRIIAAPNGVVHTGTAGSGHYTKMVHNGIEYGIMQAYAEGAHLLKEGAYPNLDLPAITQAWHHGSVIRSWLLQLLHESVSDTELLKKTSGVIHENGTGRWTVQEAKDRKVPVATIEAALAKRAWSRESGGDFASLIVALLRNKFGGHALEKKEAMDCEEHDRQRHPLEGQLDAQEHDKEINL
jgi:6-phosphogluconate dehydrogenase